MDLGAVGLDGLVQGSSETTHGFVSLGASSDPETKHKWYNGSGLFLKQERSGIAEDEEDWRSSKMAKTENSDNISSSSASKEAMLFHSRNTSVMRSNATTLFTDGQHQQQMLSFSSPKSEAYLADKCSPNATFPCTTYHPLSSSYNRNTGYSSGSMHGIFASTRGPFTPSQWMELEHQAMIYKYITANVPVPSHLLIPIKKALDSAGFCNFSSGLLRPNAAIGWGGFHLGFSNNTDPEPGRCRRTDGKKWRCSRDAVVDQKYCERHMNRGRHRSRKPVEHVVTAGTTTTTTSNTTTNHHHHHHNHNHHPANNTNASKQVIMMPTNNGSSVVVPGSTSSNNSLNFAQQQEPKNMHHPLASDSSAPNISRMFMNNSNKENGSERIPEAVDALPMLPATLDLKHKENPFLIHHKHNQIPYEESSRNEFGLVTSDSLLNPSEKSSSSTLLSTRNFDGSSQNHPSNRESDSSHHSLRHFIDDWPKLDMQSERTELSISIPLTSTDFMSSNSSPTNHDKVTLSPLRLSRELDPIQMGLGVGNGLSNDHNNTKQANWIPITWESSSMGGPLGEVLNLSNNNTTSDHHCAKINSSALNLMSDGWDNNSPPLGSSPIGVLQKTAFGSLSNSSAGSSPRAENHKTQEGASLCNDLLGSTPLGNSSSLPAL